MRRSSAWLALALLATPAGVSAYSRIFLCFFDQGSAVLTTRGRQVADTAAALYFRLRDGQETSYLNLSGPPMPAITPHIEVVGYADDASGDPGDNDALSVARAEAVATELRAQNVPADGIAVIGRGSREPLVPDSPLDPQNRRVWIIFRG